jgi:hypothetical protein
MIESAPVEMKLDQHYVDARLVALYDTDNPRGKDTDFCVRLAASLEARHRTRKQRTRSRFRV